MSEVEYLTCACKECGNSIEFPADAAGTTVACPHCAQWTELLPSPAEAKPKTSRIGLLPQVATLLLLIAVIVGAMWFWRHRQQLAQGKTETTSTNAISPQKPILPATNTPVTTNAAPREKSPDDLKVGDIQLEKTKGSSLVYAIGIVKNDSEFDRYGLRIELDVFNGKGTKIAAAKDYKDYLGPHQDWRFHALIPDSKAASAKLASLKEDQ